MPSDFMAVFTEAGPLAAFAMYLAWMQLKATQRHDKVVSDFQAQIDRLEAKREAEEERIRDRYDTVLLKYEEERKLILERMASDIAVGLNEMRGHYERIKAEKLVRATARNSRED